MKALVYNASPLRWTISKAAAVISRRAVCSGISPLQFVERPVPAPPGPDWVRLRTILGGVCGTDLALVGQRLHPGTILRNFADLPAVLGHENVAVVDEVGPEVPAWRAGQRVCVEPALGCLARGLARPCDQCRAGRPSLCQHAGGGGLPPRAMLGLNRLTGGSWAEFFVAHHSQLHAVPDDVDDDLAVLTDPVASAVHAVLRRRPETRERVLVQGSGIIALSIIAALRTLGHDNAITAVVRHPFQADLARRLGADHVLVFGRSASVDDRYQAVARHVGGTVVTGKFGNRFLIGGFDLTFDCTGNGLGLRDAMKWTRARGTLVAVGTSDIVLMHTAPIWLDELTILGANGRQIETAPDGRRLHTYDLVLEWLDRGQLDLSAIAVRRYRLADYRRAFADLLKPGRGRIVKAAFQP